MKTAVNGKDNTCSYDDLHGPPVQARGKVRLGAVAYNVHPEQKPYTRWLMNCPMCPAWMGGGMIAWSVVGLLLVVLLVVVLFKLAPKR